MTQPEFSKGLEVIPANANHGFYLVDHNTGSVCDFYFMNARDVPQQFPNAEANARLFSAAPELYEALENIVKDAKQEAEEHSRENGVYDYTTGVTEFGNDYTEDHNNYLYERLEYLEGTFTPALAKARGEQS